MRCDSVSCHVVYPFVVYDNTASCRMVHATPLCLSFKRFTFCFHHFPLMFAFPFRYLMSSAEMIYTGVLANDDFSITFTSLRFVIGLGSL